MKPLKDMTKKELQVITLEKGLVLSYKDKEGKRQRYTVDQLIKNIEATFEKENKTDFEKLVDKIQAAKDIFKLNALKVEIKNYLKAGMKSKKRSLKSSISKEYNKLTYIYNMKQMTLKGGF